MFPVEWLRASNEVLAKNTLTQSGLWRFGISGDVPIILVRLQDGGQLRLARESILAHYYLRVRGIVADLVFLNEFPGGYFQQLQEELLSLVRTSPDSGMLDRPGGIFLRTSQQISPEENILLQSVARVVFNGAAGSLEEQLDADRLYAVKKPPVPGMLVSMREVDDSLSAYDGREWECGSDVGGFVEQGRRFQLLVKRDALPPLPWSNVIANPTFGTLITETGGGYTWSQNSRENRISPWSNDPVADPISEAIFLRDTENGHYWSPTPRPVVRDTVTRVTHSAGETTFETQHVGITSTLSIVVSSDEAVKWWNITLHNSDLVARRLEAYLYVDLVMGVFQGEASRYIQSEYDAGSQTLHWVNRYNNEFAGRLVGIGSSLSIVSYTSDKVEFIGRNRSLGSPIALDAAGALRVTNFHTARRNLVRLSQRVGGGYPPCGVLKVLVNLEPGETRNFQFFLHEATSLEALRSNAVRYKKADSLSEDKEKTERSWRRLLSGVSVKTPERSFDILVNYWLLYQTVSCRLFARTGFYQSGGAFGFRDQLQDVMALLLSRPDMVRAQLLLHASRQFVEGDVQHWWHPPTGRGVRTKISDDLVWLPYCVARYCETTGDYGILDEDVQYLESAPLGDSHESYIIPSVSGQRGSLYDHCLRALDRAMRLGERGLPLMGGGDWNDGMNEVGVHGKGESVWLGWFITHTLRLFGPLVEMRDPSRATRYHEQADDLVRAIEATSWDGAWYRRAYCDDGAPLGSIRNDECQIDSIAQTWAVITGEGDPIRAQQAMDAIDVRLVEEQARIIKLLTPPFSSGSLRPGFIKGYLPGIRENGGQYTHASTWVVLANALMKRGQRAFDLFQMLNPITHTDSNSKVAVYQGEPYALCGDVYGVAPHVGRAGWSWYTGSAGWLYQIAIHHLLGIVIKQGSLTVNPCIPGTWDGFEVSITIGVPIRVKVTNPRHVESGVVAVTVNGSSVPVGPINLQGRTEELLVEVVMG
jgi:cyclic beta-1,2-glucan synthetase